MATHMEIVTNNSVATRGETTWATTAITTGTRVKVTWVEAITEAMVTIMVVRGSSGRGSASSVEIKTIWLENARMVTPRMEVTTSMETEEGIIGIRVKEVEVVVAT